jgi:ribosomal protein L11 methyltransferase
VPVQRLQSSVGDEQQIHILEGEGWGNGEHPTTLMCLNLLEKVVHSGDTVIDYGTGSGVLSVAALKLGAVSCTAVDIDEEVLAHARINLALNGCLQSTAVLHTRAVQIGSLQPANVVVANILVGALRRLIPVLCLCVAEGGKLCLSGFRPADAHVLLHEYGRYIDWDSSLTDHGTHPVWGEWQLICGTPKQGIRDAMRTQIEAELSDAAVS